MSIEQFHDLRMRAAETMQTATLWQTDPEGFCNIKANAKFGEYRTSLDPDEPFEFLGIKVEIDPSLPRNRVVLWAGENIIGAFTIRSREARNG